MEDNGHDAVGRQKDNGSAHSAIVVEKQSRKLSTRQKKARLIALVAGEGMAVTSACRELGLSRARFYEWMRNDPEFKAKLEEVQDVALEALVTSAIDRSVTKLRALGPSAVQVLSDCLESEDDAMALRAARMVLRHVQEFQTQKTLHVEETGFADLLKETSDPNGNRPLTD